MLVAARISEADYRAAQLGLSDDPIADFEYMFLSANSIPAIPMGTS